MHSLALSIALFGATVLAQSSTTASDSPVTSDTSAASTTAASTVASGGEAPTGTGPADLAASYCYPSAWDGIKTDTPCFSQEVLNQACFYGPTVFETATATPTATASPQDQQQCYCDKNGAGYMFFQFMSGCSNCFRKHGSLGGPGAYSPDFISSLSESYCAQPTATENFGKFLTSFAGTTAVATADATTSNVLGTETAVSLYFTTTPLGPGSNGTANGTAASNSTMSTVTTALNSTTSAAALTTAAPTTPAAGTGSPTAPASPQSTNAAQMVQYSGMLGAIFLGAAVLL